MIRSLLFSFGTLMLMAAAPLPTRTPPSEAEIERLADRAAKGYFGDCNFVEPLAIQHDRDFVGYEVISSCGPNPISGHIAVNRFNGDVWELLSCQKIQRAQVKAGPPIRPECFND
ncbi:hypothetical protein ACFSM5_00170 [Lacibacterium aquatile]|uniref:Uncharacterized protein n=1 Tax=Lacibacterium aquatile TaxID=1168082 RepID=A0ABW5DMV4_9PROT